MSENPYMDPEESAYASLDQTDKALGWVIGQLMQLYLEKRNIRVELEELDDEEVSDAEYRLKLIRGEETSLHRIESGMQSRMKMP